MRMPSSTPPVCAATMPVVASAGVAAVTRRRASSIWEVSRTARLPRKRPAPHAPKTSSITLDTKRGLVDGAATLFCSGASAHGTTLPLDVREEDGHLFLGQAQVRHAHPLVPGEQLGGDRISLAQDAIRLRQVAGNPAVVPAGRHAGEVWSDPLAL